MKIVHLVVPLLFAGCGASCPLPGQLELEYKQALDEACGDLKSQECEEQRPGAVERVDAEFLPRFEEAEACQQQR